MSPSRGLVILTFTVSVWLMANVSGFNAILALTSAESTVSGIWE